MSVNFLHEAFAWRALAAGLLLVAMCAPLGCFVLWRRMVYVGDGMAHAALLGIAIGVLVGIHPGIGMLVSSLLVAWLMFAGRKRFRHAPDALLGVLAHTALAAGMVVFSLVPTMRMDAFGFLFGDVLSLRMQDVVLMGAGAVLVCGIMAWQWQALLRDAFHADLAEIEGVNTRRAEYALVFCLAATVALSIQTAGVLMITAFLVIPAVAARPLARTPESMLFLSALIGAVAVLAGLLLSFTHDIPTGPAIVLVSAFELLLTSLVRPR